jgi:hypothetical protein
MKRIWVICLILLILTASGQSQEYEYDISDNKLIPPARTDIRWIIDTPTAHMLPRGAFDIDIRTFPGEGVEASLCIGLAHRFSVGIAYGGEKILSELSPEWNPKIDFKIRYRLIEETGSFAQTTIGFSSFGYGLYRDEQDTALGYHEDRYLIKSPGFYLVFSKKYPLYYNRISLHGGINYSLENGVDSDPNVFTSLTANLGYNMVFLAEYDFAINDNKSSGIFGRGRGYLNTGIGWYITPELSLELDFRNLLLNRRNLGDEKKAIDREVRLVYLQFFKD